MLEEEDQKAKIIEAIVTREILQQRFERAHIQQRPPPPPTRPQ